MGRCSVYHREHQRKFRRLGERMRASGSLGYYNNAIITIAATWSRSNSHSGGVFPFRQEISKIEYWVL